MATTNAQGAEPQLDAGSCEANKENVSQPESLSQESEESGDKAEKDGSMQGFRKGPRLSFKGNPGEVGFQRRIDIVKAVMGHPVAKYMARGQRTETFKKVCIVLNFSDNFQGQLKWEQVRDKFKEAEDQADAIISHGEEKWIKLRQNGSCALNELDELYVDLAGNIKEWKGQKELLEQENNEACAIANENLMAAMETTKRRYNAGGACADALDADAEKTPDTGKEHSAASEESGGSGDKRDGQKAFGAGSNTGSASKKQRGPTNAGLLLDNDPRAEYQSSSANVLDFLRTAFSDEAKQREADSVHKADKARAAMRSAQAAEKLEAANAAVLRSKAELLDKLIKCRELGIELPVEIMEDLKK